MRRRALFVLLWLLLPLLAAAQGPRLENDAAGAAWLHDLPPLLQQPEVRKKLDTGLTTSFELKLEIGKEQRVVALFNVRFEPWDEIYEVSWIDARGRLEKLEIKSFEDLLGAWSGLRLQVGTLAAPSGRSEKLRLLIEVVPFSQREQHDTQRWFSDSLAQAGQGTAEGAAGSGEDSRAALGQALSVLMATSIERRSALSFRFSLPSLPQVARSGR